MIILTDSDAAGFQIRHFLSNTLGKDAKLTHVYIPALYGKERRKRAPSAEGLLGVEGMDEEMLAAAFARAGVGFARCDTPGSLNKADLLEAKLIGVRDAAQRRRLLAASLSLPPRLSSETLLRLLNTFLTRDAFFDLINDLNRQESAALESPHDALPPTEK